MSRSSACLQGQAAAGIVSTVFRTVAKTLGSNNAETAAMNAQLTTELQALKTEHALSQVRDHQMITTARRVIKLHKTELSQLRSQLSQCRTAHAQEQGRVEGLRNELATALSERDQLQGAQAQFAQREAGLRAQLEAAQTDFAQREAELSAQLEASQALSTRLAAAQPEFDQREAALCAQLETSQEGFAQRKAELSAQLEVSQAESARREAALSAELAAAQTEFAQQEEDLREQLATAYDTCNLLEANCDGAKLEHEEALLQLERSNTELGASAAAARDRCGRLQAELAAASATRLAQEVADLHTLRRVQCTKMAVAAAQHRAVEDALEQQLSRAEDAVTELGNWLQAEGRFVPKELRRGPRIDEEAVRAKAERRATAALAQPGSSPGGSVTGGGAEELDVIHFMDQAQVGAQVRGVLEAAVRAAMGGRCVRPRRDALAPIFAPSICGKRDSELVWA